ncbi:MAG: aminodeoxychorismate synthase component I [Gemmatimonadales bacterium]
MSSILQELVPAPDPVETARRLLGSPFPIFLDSSAYHPGTGRYSWLSADPVVVLQSSGGMLTRFWPGTGRRETGPGDPLLAARDMLGPPREPLPGIPPFQGGFAGYIGYEYGGRLETLPTPRFHEALLPEVSLALYDWVLAWDQTSGRAWLISTGLPETGAEAARRAASRMLQVQDLIARGSARPPGPVAVHSSEAPAFPVELPGLAAPADLRSTFTREGYQAAVRRVIDYIRAGDVFQVNLSQRFRAPAPRDPFEIYTGLRHINPAAASAYLDLGAAAIASASPERFLRLDPGTRMVETRPIKGTRPRGRTPAEDRALRDELSRSGKDRAENVMIVDLLRNDLSRVCDPGSIEVPDLLAIEEHPTVFHLVSTVTGRLGAGRDAVDLLQAAFPGGSITGAPKVRAMEIIAELEPVERGPYCGSIGYWSATGALDTSIVIRSLVFTGGWSYAQAGGGIVADSDPEQEYLETIDKARALLAALAE